MRHQRIANKLRAIANELDPNQKTVWQYSPGDVEQGSLAIAVQSDNSHRKKCGEYQINSPVGYIPPFVEADGIRCNVHRELSNGHCMFRPISGELGLGYTVIGKTYQILLDATLLGDWLNHINWAIIFQGWSSKQNNPPISIAVKKGQWDVNLKVEDQGVDIHKRFAINPEVDRWLITLRSSETDGCLKVEHDGETWLDYQNKPTLPWGSLPHNLTFGCYAARELDPPGAVVKITKVKIDDVS